MRSMKIENSPCTFGIDERRKSFIKTQTKSKFSLIYHNCVLHKNAVYLPLCSFGFVKNNAENITLESAVFDFLHNLIHKYTAFQVFESASQNF